MPLLTDRASGLLPTSFSGVAALLLIAFAAYHIGGIIYNVALHPLRKFPGPIESRMSKWPFARRHVRGQQIFHTQRMHDRYGPVVRIGPNHLSFTDPRGWNDIYGHGAGAKCNVPEMDKAKIFTRPVLAIPTHTMSADYDEHRRLRRALNPGFSDGSMRNQEQMMNKYVQLMIQRLSQQGEGGKQPLDMAEWYNFAGFDISSDLIYGESFHCLETVGYHPWVAVIMKTLRFHAFLLALGYAGASQVVQWIHKLGGLLPMKSLKGFTDSMLKSRLSIGEPRDDLYEGIVKKREEWGQMSVNAVVLLMAGSETTSTALSGMTYLLLSHPDVLKKVTDEIRGAFADASDINMSSTAKLPYTGAMVTEAMRMYPPLGAGMVRIVPRGGAEIAGHFVPEGTMVEMQHWATNHSKENWSDPWTFRPERFLVSAKEAEARGDKLHAAQVFSTGPRNCIGKNLAYAMIRLILANIIWNFDMAWGSEESKTWLKEQKNFNIWDRPPLDVYLTPRTMEKEQSEKTQT